MSCSSNCSRELRYPANHTSLAMSHCLSWSYDRYGLTIFPELHTRKTNNYSVVCFSKCRINRTMSGSKHKLCIREDSRAQRILLNRSTNKSRSSVTDRHYFSLSYYLWCYVVTPLVLFEIQSGESTCEDQQERISRCPHHEKNSCTLTYDAA